MMTHKHWIASSLAGFGLLLGVSSTAVAQMSPHQMQPSKTEQTDSFRRIDQPLWLKGAVTTGGIGLIGAELWWFLFSKSKSRRDDTS
jgi:plastocyanin domain-containing protein